MSWQSHDLVEEGAYATTRNLSVSLERYVAQAVENVDLSLRIIVDRMEAGGLHDRERIRALLRERVENAPQIASIFIVDEGGRIVHHSLDLPLQEVDVSDRRYFTAVRDDPAVGLYVGAPVISRASGAMRISLSRRISGPDGSFAGAVVAAVDPERFRSFFETLDLGPRGLICLFAADGTLLVRQPAMDGTPGRSYRHAKLFNELLPDSPIGSFEAASPTDGLTRLISYRRVGDLPFVVDVALPKDEIFAAWRRTTWINGGVALAIIAALALLGLRLTRELRARAAAQERTRRTIRELQEARSLAEESSRAKSDFMANMSHELRTPLNAILGFSEIIEGALFGPLDERYRRYGGDIRTSGRHLLELITNILDFTKIESGRLVLQDEEVVLGDIVDESVRVYTPICARLGLTLATAIGDRALRLRSDRRVLQQILLNLLSNATKFTPGGGTVTIHAELQGSDLALAIEDTGIGIAEADRTRVLEPFGQITSPLTRGSGGTGLGLATVKSLVELHGGRLILESASGAGTRVTLLFPAYRVLQRAAA
jgi:signal transduction histidine kinase